MEWRAASGVESSRPSGAASGAGWVSALGVAWAVLGDLGYLGLAHDIGQDRVITPEHRRAAVDGLITGWHEPQASHLQMLAAIAGADVLADSYTAALEDGYLWHEFGDSHLILP